MRSPELQFYVFRENTLDILFVMWSLLCGVNCGQWTVDIGIRRFCRCLEFKSSAQRDNRTNDMVIASLAYTKHTHTAIDFILWTRTMIMRHSFDKFIFILHFVRYICVCVCVSDSSGNELSMLKDHSHLKIHSQSKYIYFTFNGMEFGSRSFSNERE